MKLSQDASYSKEVAEIDLKKYESTMPKFDESYSKVNMPTIVQPTSGELAVGSAIGGSRLFANHDDSINVVNVPGLLDTSNH